MSRETLTKVVGACCGLAAFAIAIVAGLAADNPGEVILFRALVCMFVCQALGLGIGAVIERVMSDSIRAHKRSRAAAQRPDVAVGAPTVGAMSSIFST